MRVAMASESSNNCLRADTGINTTDAPSSTAASTIPTAFASGSTDPPRTAWDEPLSPTRNSASESHG